MNNILIIGFGVASTAYASLLDYNKNKIFILGTPLDKKKIIKINKNKKKIDPIFQVNFSNNVQFFSNIKKLESIKFSLVVVGVNTNGLEWAINQINLINLNCPILLLTKGLCVFNDKIQTISDYLKSKTKIKHIVSATGPCLAGELIKRTHTRTLLSSTSIKVANFVKNILKNNFYHPVISNDYKGSEICAAIKNIYATVIGAAMGQSNSYLKFKDKKNNYFNAASFLFEQSLKEMTIIVKKYKGKPDTVLGPAGAGDLYVSALGGRNSKLGFFLGQGFNFKKIISSQMRNITVEGSDLILKIGSILIREIGSKKLPLLNFLFTAIVKNQKFIINWKKISN